MKEETLKLISDEDTKAQPLFSTERAYQEFCTSFQEQVKGELDRHREARRQSEEQAKRLLIS